LRHIVDAMRPQVENAIERAFGTTLLLARPNASRLAAWRNRAQTIAAREAGYAYAAYGHLKVASVTEEIAAALARVAGAPDKLQQESIRRSVWEAVRAAELTAEDAVGASGAQPHVIGFLRNFDLSYRIRRLRLMSRRLSEIDAREVVPSGLTAAARTIVYDLIGLYSSASERAAEAKLSAADIQQSPAEAMAAYARLLDLRSLDDKADLAVAKALESLPKTESRALVLTYLGFPFYDIATLPLLQGEGLDEFDPVKVDRISPDDAAAIRRGGAEATLKGIQFNSFGAFFSRAYRENDYLWGRLHGADRLIDIILSTLPEKSGLPPSIVARMKRDIFRAIVEEEKPRLTQISGLFEELDREIG